MAICVHCGRQIMEGVRFCGICGGEQPTDEELESLGIAKASHQNDEKTEAKPNSWQERWRNDQESVEQAERLLSQPAGGISSAPKEDTADEKNEQPLQESLSPREVGSPEMRASAKQSRALPLLLAGSVGLVVGLIVMLAVVWPWHKAQSSGKQSAEASTSPLVLRISAKGLDADGSRIPVQVTSSKDPAEYQQKAYVGLDGTTLELPSGTYTVEALGSPIASDGTLYAYEEAKVEVSVGSTDKTGETPALVLEPVDPASLTEEQIAAAVAWAADDEARSDVADSLGEKARSAQREARRAAVADSYAQVLDNIGTLDFGTAFAQGYGYALADMTSDGVPELLVAAQVEPADWFFKAMVYDEATGSTTQVGETMRYYTYRETLRSYSDGHALLQTGHYGSTLTMQDLTVSDGQIVSKVIGQYGDNDAPDLDELDATEVEFVDPSDRAQLEALKSHS